MIVQKLRFCLLPLLAILWALVLSLSLQVFPVGMTLDSDAQVSLSAVSVFADGREKESPRKDLKKGRNSFGIDNHATTFYFKFHSLSGKRNEVVPVLSMDFWGMPALSSDRIVQFKMNSRLHRADPEKGAPLLLYVSDGDSLNLTNVFPFVHRILKLGAEGITWLPFIFCAVIALINYIRKDLMAQVLRVIDFHPLFICVGATVMILTFPLAITSVTPGLDPSWIWLFNKYAFEESVGRDFVFTYGPLGFLISPQLTLLNMWWGIGVNAAFFFLTAWLGWMLYRRGMDSIERGCCFLLILLWALPWPNGMEWKWCVVSVMACLFGCFYPRLSNVHRFVLLGFAAFSAVLQSFVKFSSCIAVLGEHAVILVVYLLRARIRSRVGIGIYGLTLVVSLALFVFMLFPDFWGVVDWVRGSMEISSGYNLYMGSEKSWLELLAVIALLIGLSFSMGIGKEERRGRFLYWLIFSPLLFCTYKYALVRQTAIPLALFLAWFSVCQIFFIKSAWRKAIVFALFCIVVSIGVDVVWCGGGVRLDLSMCGIHQVMRPALTVRRMAVEGRSACEPARLARRWLEQIGTNPVMIVGWEMGPAMTGDLNFIPLPSVQTYSAYTPYLDALCEARITSANPEIDFILAPATPWTFDARNIYFDNPRLWNAVRERYDYLGTDKDHVILRRKKGEFAQKNLRMGKKFEISRSNLGKMQSLFFRTPRTSAYFTFLDGTTYVCSANVEVLNGTEVPRMLPTAPEHLPAFFGASGECPIVRNIRIVPADAFSLVGKLDY